MTPDSFADAVIRLLRPSAQRPTNLLLAVSGGPDSVGMLVLAIAARDRLRQSGLSIASATIDHGLRPEAADEARDVSALCAAHAVPHAVLEWRPAGAGNLAARAREARYALLEGHARAIGAAAVATAHTLDDRIEAVLMARAGEARGVSPAGMRPSRDLAPGVRLLRPLLDVRKRTLADIARQAGVPTVDDPSNADPRFARARARAAAARLTADEEAAILAGIRAAARERANADAGLLALIKELAPQIDDCGRLSFSVEPWRSHPLAGPFLSRAIAAAGGGLYPPARFAVLRLVATLSSADGISATLGGCRVSIKGRDLVLTREYGRTGPPPAPMTPRCHAVFDRRFDIEPGEGLAGCLRPLGVLGRGNPVERSLPVLFDANEMVVAAHPAVSLKAGTTSALRAVERIGWRLVADLADGGHAAAEIASSDLR